MCSPRSTRTSRSGAAMRRARSGRKCEAITCSPAMILSRLCSKLTGAAARFMDSARHLFTIRNVRIVGVHGIRSDDGCGDRRIFEAREAANVGLGEDGTGGIRGCKSGGGGGQIGRAPVRERGQI